MTPDELSDRLWQFAGRVGKVVDALPDTRLGRHVANQLVRSGTAAAPNYDEGRVGESRADFVHKVNVALKELVETRGWVKFIVTAELLPSRRIECFWMNAINFAGFSGSPSPPQRRTVGCYVPLAFARGRDYQLPILNNQSPMFQRI